MRWSDLQIEAGQVLELGEIHRVVTELRRRLKIDPRRFRLRLRDLCIFRLSTCCGLRASEIARLRLPRVHDSIARPYLVVIEGAKNNRTRTVPLYLDAGTLEDIRRWLEYRRTLELDHDCVLVRMGRARGTEPMARYGVWAAYKRAVALALHGERARTITTHTGRHTFASHAVQRFPIPHVRDWLGHSNVAMTSRYLHVLELADKTVGDLFAVPMQNNGGASVGTAAAPSFQEDAK